MTRISSSGVTGQSSGTAGDCLDPARHQGDAGGVQDRRGQLRHPAAVLVGGLHAQQQYGSGRGVWGESSRGRLLAALSAILGAAVVDPAQGTPARVQLCPAVCERIKADPNGSVQVRFGCKSRSIE
jgi:hypothetical protein